MKKLSLFLVFSLFVFTTIGQNVGKKIETKYYRPSITPLFYQPQSQQEELIIKKLQGLDMVAKFNDHRINFPYLVLNGNVKDYLKKSSNLIMAKWWNRDSNGNFNYELVASRGEYSATDADAMQAKAANTDRREMIGEKLVGKTYVFLYQITKLRTMEQVYDEIDAANRKYQKEFKPVKRDNEGFVLNFNVSAYKLNYNDSVASGFYSEYWTDAKNHDAAKVAKWDVASFPLNLATTISAELSSTQPKDPKYYIYTKKKTMTELLEDFPVAIQTKAIDDLSKKIEDFRVKAPIFKTEPLSAKIGTKEGLYLDERYFVYEIVLDKKNNEAKQRMGVARVQTIADNSKVATGDSKPSTFQQQGGSTLYEGMLMESKPDMGLIINAGYSLLNPNQSLGGIKLGVDESIARYANISGLYIGLDLTFNAMDNVNPGHITALDDAGKPLYMLTDGVSKFSGYTTALSINLSKEIYFTKRGNIFLKPSVGVGFAGYTFTASTDNTIKFSLPDPDDSEKEIQNPWYSWSSMYVPVNIGFGINLLPSIVLEVKPEIIARFASSTGQMTLSNGDKKSYTLKQNTTTATPEMKNWGFDNIGGMSINPSLIFSLRVRL